MSVRVRWLTVIMAVMVLFSASSAKPFQQGDGDTIIFDETGKSVSGPFAAMWKSASDPFVVFGYPISDVVPHPIDPNVQVQYFQRARMEYNPSLPAGQQLSLTDLGKYFYNENENGVSANLFVTPAACRYFAETGQSICYLFRDFYEKHNGEEFFGLPISDARKIDGRIVQYFEKVKLEWRPENEIGRRIKLTDLGQLYYDVNGAGGDAGPAIIGAAKEVKLLHAFVRVFPAKPLVGANENQALFIIVQNQLLEPYPDAQVAVTLEYPDGKVIKNQPLHNTGADGVTRLENISTAGVQPNQFIKVTVTVKVKELASPIQTVTWFRIWW